MLTDRQTIQNPPSVGLTQAPKGATEFKLEHLEAET